jgi:uncharacterized protein DUF1648
MLHFTAKIALLCNVAAMFLALAMVIIAVARWKSLPEKIVARYDMDGRPEAWSSRRVVWIYPILTFAVLALTADKMGPFNLFVAAMLLFQMLHTLKIADQKARALPGWFMPVLTFGSVALCLLIYL